MRKLEKKLAVLLADDEIGGFAEGAVLPASLAISCSFQRDGKNELRVSEGAEQLALIEYKRVSSSESAVARVRVVVTVDASGCFAANVIDERSGVRLLCRCVTLKQAGVVGEDESEQPASRGRLIVGFENTQGELEVLHVPKDQLPVMVRFSPSDVPKASVKLLAVREDALGEAQLRELMARGVVQLSSAIAVFELVTFYVGRRTREWQLEIDVERRLSVTAIDARDAAEPGCFDGDKRFVDLSADYTSRGREIPVRAHPVAEGAPKEGASSPSARGEPLVFLSHRTDVDGAFAMSLAHALEANGSRCWIAPRDIAHGTNWNRAIMGAVEGCDVMLVVVSAEALDSEYVQAEVHRALNLKKPVVPVLMQSSLAYTDLDARLETRQRLDWYRMNKEEKGRLGEILKAQLSLGGARRQRDRPADTDKA